MIDEQHRHERNTATGTSMANNNTQHDDTHHETSEHSSLDSAENVTDGPDDGAVGLAARSEEFERTAAALTERVLELESKPQRDRLSRRSILGLLGVAGLAGLGTGAASADPQGQIGTQNDPLAGLYTMNVESPQDQLRFLAHGSLAGVLGFDGSSPDTVFGTGHSLQTPSAGRTISGGASNKATGELSSVAGGSNSVASGYLSTVGGGRNHEANDHYTTVGGGIGNTASFSRATVSGGGSNTADGGGSTVGGGTNNRAGGYQSTVSGGGNRIDESRGNAAYTNYSTVSGGTDNKAGTDGPINIDVAATVGGGENNTASATRATVSGGKNNEASGDHATVPGGEDNRATAPHAFAAGRGAVASHEGSFVWSDTSSGGLNSAKNNEFVVSASGGVYLFSNSAASTGVELSPGSGSWSSSSSRRLKSDVKPISSEKVLNQVTDLEVATWSYDSQDGVRHMGPMAEEFYEAFELGAGEDKISNVDADGVALAAIQGLAKRGAGRAAKIDAQGDRLENLEQENDALRERLAALEEQVDADSN